MKVQREFTVSSLLPIDNHRDNFVIYYTKLTTQTLTLEQLKQKPLEETLQSVLTNRQVLTVQLPNGGEVIIQPKPQLKPLPILEGYIPEGWREAIYNDPEGSDSI